MSKPTCIFAAFKDFIYRLGNEGGIDDIYIYIHALFLTVISVPAYFGQLPSVVCKILAMPTHFTGKSEYVVFPYIYIFRVDWF